MVTSIRRQYPNTGYKHVQVYDPEYRTSEVSEKYPRSRSRACFLITGGGEESSTKERKYPSK
eukprot:673015-Prymnesium_polylepis.1